MPGFCASIVLAFILGVKLFDYVVVDGANLCEPGWGRKSNGGYDLRIGGGERESNLQDVMSSSYGLPIYF